MFIAVIVIVVVVVVVRSSSPLPLPSTTASSSPSSRSSSSSYVSSSGPVALSLSSSPPASLPHAKANTLLPVLQWPLHSCPTAIECLLFFQGSVSDSVADTSRLSKPRDSSSILAKHLGPGFIYAASAHPAGLRRAPWLTGESDVQHFKYVPCQARFTHEAQKSGALLFSPYAILCHSLLHPCVMHAQPQETPRAQ